MKPKILGYKINGGWMWFCLIDGTAWGFISWRDAINRAGVEIQLRKRGT